MVQALFTTLEKNAEWQSCLELRSFSGEKATVSRSPHAKIAIQQKTTTANLI
jgi:hypothetical protein